MDCPIASRAARRRNDKRNRVLDEAEKMFTADTYSAVRIEEVADAADISVGTVYNYFGGKEGLYLAVSERVLDRVEELLAPAYDPDLDAERAITLLGERYLQALISHPIACRSLVSETQTPGGDIAEAARDRIARLYDAAASLIDRGISEGVVTPIDSALAARFIIGAWNGVFASTFTTLGPTMSTESVSRTLQLGTEILRRGMSATAPDDVTAPDPDSSRDDTAH